MTCSGISKYPTEDYSSKLYVNKILKTIYFQLKKLGFGFWTFYMSFVNIKGVKELFLGNLNHFFS